jgi:hypothetical protein
MYSEYTASVAPCLAAKSGATRRSFIGLQTLILIVALLLNAACATRSFQAYDPASRHQIKRIGVLTPGLPQGLDVRLRVHPGDSFGMIGMLVGEREMLGKGRRFSDAVSSEGFHYESFFRDQLILALRAEGYEVVPIPVGRRYDELRFLERYPANEAGVDAYLDLYSARVGYAAVAANTPYRPNVYMFARLIAADGGKVLFQDQVAYNALGDEGDAITVPGQPGYEFSSFDELVADRPHAVEGLKLALQSTGAALARQLQ